MGGRGDIGKGGDKGLHLLQCAEAYADPLTVSELEGADEDVFVQKFLSYGLGRPFDLKENKIGVGGDVGISPVFELGAEVGSGRPVLFPDGLDKG